MTQATRWTSTDIPDLTGTTAVVTGANSGLGLVTAEQLSRHGASVTLAVRDTQRGDTAAGNILERNPQANVSVAALDLADLGSVRTFAEHWSAAHPAGLNLLVNNAGVMALPRRESADGYEMQFATNHLGHFALTGLLLSSLVAAGAHQPSRVVTLSSQAHRMGRMNFADLQGVAKYRPWGAYGQSKLANLLFANELSRRLRLAALPVISLAAHPGYASTNLQSAGPRMKGSRWGERTTSVANRLFGQSAEMGALPTLYAATQPHLPSGVYIGPDGFGEQRGHPTLVGMTSAALNRADAEQLWAVSEDLTQVVYLDDER
jgi:NAD(P)-dependent dehydrogenase (short-subunit alcohol dehydrogenase family)